MQFEIALRGKPEEGYGGRDLGYLLHKHPDRVFRKDVSCGEAVLFFSEATDAAARAVLHVETDPVGMVRRSGRDARKLLETYVNDRPYAADSFLSLAIGKCLGQAMAGRCDARPDLAAAELPFECRVTPLRADPRSVRDFFEPLGFAVAIADLGAPLREGRPLLDVTLTRKARLSDVLRQVVVLVPALDGWKHHFVDEDDVTTILARGEGWLETHPHSRRILVDSFSRKRRLGAEAHAHMAAASGVSEAEVEALEEEWAENVGPHAERHDAVMRALAEARARSVIDLGCGEGRLLRRLLRSDRFDRILGVEVDPAEIVKARRLVGMDGLSEHQRRRIEIRPGSLVYADPSWQGFDAATLVEVIEHVDPERLRYAERSVFGVARPGTVVVTTPNKDFNASFRFPTYANGLRHPDHRFEWTRAEFAAWADRVCDAFGYSARLADAGTWYDPDHGPLTQMAVFTARN